MIVSFSQRDLKILALENKEFYEDLTQKLFKFLRLENRPNDQDAFLTYMEDGRLKALLQLETPKLPSNVYTLKFISVHPLFKKQGIGKRLLEEMTTRVYKKDPDAILEISPYEGEGEVLLPIIRHLASRYPSLQIFHSKQGEPVQNAKSMYFSRGDEVLILYPREFTNKRGKIKWFKPDSTPLCAIVELLDTNKETILQVETNYLRRV